MRSWLRAVVLMFLAGAASSTAADPELRASKPTLKQQVVAIIEAQLAAFRKGDVEKAYTYASPELRAQKPLRDFTTIVRENYPEIWANTGAEFGIVRDNGTQATVTVQVYSNAGDAAYDYTLATGKAGWRIYGVVRHAPKQKGKV